MFCCDLFKGLATNAGKRGISVIAHAESGYNGFFLQARMCDRIDESRMTNIPKGCEVPKPLTVAMQVGLKYCPFCGSNLGPLIANYKDEFDEFADKCGDLPL